MHKVRMTLISFNSNNMDLLHSASTSFVICFKKEVNTQLPFIKKFLLTVLSCINILDIHKYAN